MGCIACVPEDKLYMIERFGEYKRTASPGCACVGVPIVDTVRGAVSRRVHQIVVNAETKTKDNVFVNVGAAIQYKVVEEKASESFYNLESPIDLIKSCVFDVVRATVPKMLLDEVFESKDRIASEVKDHLEGELGTHGFEILDTLIIDVTPAYTVKVSMNSINAQKRLRKAAEERAESQKLVVVKAAEAEAEYQYLQGLGIARQRHAIIKGISESVDHFSTNTSVSTKQVTDLLIVNQYFDTIKELGKSHNSKVMFVNQETGDQPEDIRESLLHTQIAR